MLEDTIGIDNTQSNELFVEAGPEPTQADTHAEGENLRAGSEEESQSAEPSYAVTFNGNKLELPLSEILTNAQKGLNYDYVVKQRDDLKNAREFAVLDRHAEANRMNREQFLDYLEQYGSKLRGRTEADNSMPEHVARKLYALEQKEEQWKNREYEEQLQQRERQKYSDFVKEFPDVKEFPPEVLNQIVAGSAPVDAYRAYENQKLKDENTILKKQQENREKNAGSVWSDASSNNSDAFVSGFSSIFH